MTVNRQRLGRVAEDLVARALQGAGWRIVERNARTPDGEIDLIALEGRTLVFVEVKGARSGRAAGPVSPAHAVGPRKQARLRRLARAWLAARRESPRRLPLGVAGYRFDVVGVSFDAAGRADLDHFRNAF
jgi:putative endonuclease